MPEIEFNPKDQELYQAVVAVAIKAPVNTHARILAELIRCSTNSFIHQPAQAGIQIQKYLNVSAENYRATMAKLTKLGLICREDGGIRLQSLAQSPCSAIVIKPKAGVKNI